MQLADRAHVDPFIVMDVLREANAAEAAGRSIIHMEVGQPATPAPATARAALRDGLENSALGYTEGLGLPALREGIAGLYKRWYNLDLKPERVIVTAGSSAAFILAFTALFEAGQRVGVCEPGYPSYRSILKALSLTPVGLATQDEDHHRLQPAALQDADIAGAIVASPNNPTGTMLDRAALAGLIAAMGDRAFISDEIYHGLEWGERAVSALEITDEVYVINSFSKYFSMTGWRVGWMVVPETHVRTLERLAQNLFICAPHASQLAALGALQGHTELLENRSVYEGNRTVLLEGLRAAGFTKIAPPDGAFYIYADVSEITGDSRAFAAEILAKAGVAVTPGLDFDPKRGGATLRFSYAGSRADMIEGAARLKAFMAARE
ncbi:MAG: aspartate/methionine/tyrosine aminotransferase [Dinoroseobacter sp.]|jgi:aspartate/methionine/tyrosine aminotransferase